MTAALTVIPSAALVPVELFAPTRKAAKAAKRVVEFFTA